MCIMQVKWLERSRCLPLSVDCQGQLYCRGSPPKEVLGIINCIPKEYNYRGFFLYIENNCCSDLIRLRNRCYPRVGFIIDNEVVSVVF